MLSLFARCSTVAIGVSWIASTLTAGCVAGVVFALTISRSVRSRCGEPATLIPFASSVSASTVAAYIAGSWIDTDTATLLLVLACPLRSMLFEPGARESHTAFSLPVRQSFVTVAYFVGGS